MSGSNVPVKTAVRDGSAVGFAVMRSGSSCAHGAACESSRPAPSAQPAEVVVVVVDVRADPEPPPAAGHGDRRARGASRRPRRGRPRASRGPRSRRGPRAGSSRRPCQPADRASSRTASARSRIRSRDGLGADLQQQPDARAERLEARHVERAALPALGARLEGEVDRRASCTSRRRCASRRRAAGAARSSRGGRRAAPPPPARAATCGRRRRGSRSASARRRSTSGPSPWIASTKSATPRARQSSAERVEVVAEPRGELDVADREDPRRVVDRRGQVVDPDPPVAAGDRPERHAPARQVHPGVDVRRDTPRRP